MGFFRLYCQSLAFCVLVGESGAMFIVLQIQLAMSKSASAPPSFTNGCSISDLKTSRTEFGLQMRSRAYLYLYCNCIFTCSLVLLLLKGYLDCLTILLPIDVLLEIGVFS